MRMATVDSSDAEANLTQMMALTGPGAAGALLEMFFSSLGLRPYEDNLHHSAAHAVIQGAVMVGTIGTAIAAWHAIPAIGKFTARAAAATAAAGKAPIEGLMGVLFARRTTPFKRRESNYRWAVLLSVFAGILLSVLGTVFHLPVVAHYAGLSLDQPACGLYSDNDGPVTADTPVWWRVLQYTVCFLAGMAWQVQSLRPVLYLPGFLYTSGWFTTAEYIAALSALLYLVFFFWLRGRTKVVQEEHKVLQSITE